MKKGDWIAFDVLGVAVPSPRGRVGRNNVYMDRKSEHWKMQVRDAAEDAMRRAGWKTCGDATGVDMEFVMVRRASRTDDSTLHTTRPDIDNLVKLVMDALTRAKVYRDDGVVVKQSAKKRWQRAGERFAGVRVSVSRIGDGTRRNGADDAEGEE